MPATFFSADDASKLRTQVECLTFGNRLVASPHFGGQEEETKAGGLKLHGFDLVLRRFDISKWLQRGRVHWVLTWHLGHHGLNPSTGEALLLLQKSDVSDDSAVLLIGPLKDR